MDDEQHGGVTDAPADPALPDERSSSLIEMAQFGADVLVEVRQTCDRIRELTAGAFEAQGFVTSELVSGEIYTGLPSFATHVPSREELEKSKQLTKLPQKKRVGSEWKVVGYSDYLDVKYRLLFMKQQHPEWAVRTRPVEVNVKDGYAICLAQIVVPVLTAAGVHEYVLAEDVGFETRDSFGDFIQKASTNAIGRALLACGYGIQFTDELDIEAGREAAGRFPGVDSGIPERSASQTSASQNGRSHLVDEAVKLGAKPVKTASNVTATDGLPSDVLIPRPASIVGSKWNMLIAGCNTEVSEDEDYYLNLSKFVTDWRERGCKGWKDVFGERPKQEAVPAYLARHDAVPLRDLISQHAP